MPLALEVIEFHGLPAVRWRSAEGASAIATLQGAHLVSWTLPGGDECLYLSDRSAFAAGRAIRGGVPVIFPQFADRGPLAQHGFARTQEWVFTGAHESEAGACAAFGLESSARTRAIWPHEFRLVLVATLGASRLEMRLHVRNTGGRAFSFSSALHTYLRVRDSRAIGLHGLAGISYVERGIAERRVETRERITAQAPIDRIYFGAPHSTRLEEGTRTVNLRQQGFTDVVVWNPGPERTAQMADMPAEGFLRMLCVEAAAVEPAVTLAPGHGWTGTQSIAIG